MMTMKLAHQARQMIHRFAAHAQRCAVAERGKNYNRLALCVLIFERYSAIY
jgi:hypothetical protein